MIVIKAIAIGLFFYVSESVANICSGRWNGDQLKNPSDCSSFYVCSYGEPKLFKCLDNLLYDPVKRVCNWAHMVDCGAIGTEGHIPVLPNPPYEPQPEEQHGTQEHQTQPPLASTNSPYTPHPPPVIDVTNIPEHNKTDEFPGLEEYPLNVFHCTNPEFYFAPHPRICEKYFICENYQIHAHQCGEGIYWDYVYQQCDFPSKSFCYSTDTTYVEPPSNEPITTESVTNEPITTESDTNEPITAEPTINGPITVSNKPTIEIECPKNTQVFLGDPANCRKYYICIAGNPIITSCPDNTAWDEEMKQCNEGAWSLCNP